MTRDRVQSFRARDARGLLRARRLASAWLIVAAAALTSTGMLDARQAPSPEILAKAAAHVQHFIAGMSNVVAVETYEQAQQTNGMRAVTLSTRRTRADLLVLPLGESGWVPFRDVYEVDGQRVRDRDEGATTEDAGQCTRPKRRNAIEEDDFLVERKRKLRALIGEGKRGHDLERLAM